MYCNEEHFKTCPGNVGSSHIYLHIQYSLYMCSWKGFLCDLLFLCPLLFHPSLPLNCFYLCRNACNVDTICFLIVFIALWHLLLFSKCTIIMQHISLNW